MKKLRNKNLTFTLVKNAVGSNSFDLGSICKSENLNKWGLHRKYFHYDADGNGFLSDTGLTLAGVGTAQDRKDMLDKNSFNSDYVKDPSEWPSGWPNPEEGWPGFVIGYFRNYIRSIGPPGIVKRHGEVIPWVGTEYDWLIDVGDLDFYFESLGEWDIKLYEWNGSSWDDKSDDTNFWLRLEEKDPKPEYEERIARGMDRDNYKGRLNNWPIHSITIEAEGNTVTDDGNGNLQGDGSGTIDYNEGIFDVTFNTNITKSEIIWGTYDVPITTNGYRSDEAGYYLVSNNFGSLDINTFEFHQLKGYFKLDVDALDSPEDYDPHGIKDDENLEADMDGNFTDDPDEEDHRNLRIAKISFNHRDKDDEDANPEKMTSEEINNTFFTENNVDTPEDYEYMIAQPSYAALYVLPAHGLQFGPCEGVFYDHRSDNWQGYFENFDTMYPDNYPEHGEPGDGDIDVNKYEGPQFQDVKFYIPAQQTLTLEFTTHSDSHYPSNHIEGVEEWYEFTSALAFSNDDVNMINYRTGYNYDSSDDIEIEAIGNLGSWVTVQINMRPWRTEMYDASPIEDMEQEGKRRVKVKATCGGVTYYLGIRQVIIYDGREEDAPTSSGED